MKIVSPEELENSYEILKTLRSAEAAELAWKDWYLFDPKDSRFEVNRRDGCKIILSFSATTLRPRDAGWGI